MKYAVIGHPISHSLSPVMHNANFKALGIDAEYRALNIPPQHIHHLRSIAKEYELDGFNVTIPFKSDVLSMLDAVDSEAEMMGAVNTVKIEGDTWTGYNTDGTGYKQGLLDAFDLELQGLNVLIIGAGGASKSLARSLMMSGANMYVANRTLSRFADWPFKVNIVPLEDIDDYSPLMDLIINTTPVGMQGFEHEALVNMEALKKSAIVSDIVYTPAMTPFLTAAEQRGLRVHNGLAMFVNQGAESFKHWTGRQADKSEMTRAVLAALAK